MQKAKDIMTPGPRLCRASHTVMDAVKIMREEDVGVVPIVDDNDVCIGIVTDRDVVLNVVAENRDPNTTILENIMTSDPTCCSPEDGLDTVLDRMEDRMVRRIPVIDKQGHCIGIITEGDLATRAEDKSMVSELVETVT